MNHFRFLSAVVVTGLILALFVVSAVVAGGPQGKTTICHSAGGHKYVQITVSNNALPAHMRHGDTMPDEYGDCP